MAAASNTDEKHFDLKVFCFPVNETKEGLWERPKKWLRKGMEDGGGAFGSIAEVCKKNTNDCDYVMKIMSINETADDDAHVFGYRSRAPIVRVKPLDTRFEVSPQDFWKEVELQESAAALGVAPPVCDCWICEDPPIGVIIMPTLQKTLEAVFEDDSVTEERKKTYVDDAEEILQKLNTNNIYHRDAHLANFMIDFNGEVKIIDFGFAVEIPSCPRGTPDCIVWKKEFYQKDRAKLRETQCDYECDCGSFFQ